MHSNMVFVLHPGGSNSQLFFIMIAAYHFGRVCNSLSHPINASRSLLRSKIVMFFSRINSPKLVLIEYIIQILSYPRAICPKKCAQIFCDVDFQKYTLSYSIAYPTYPLRTQDETGMYRTAEKGEIEYFPGVNSSFELPQKPDLILGTSKLDVGIRAGRVIEPLHNQGFLKNKPKDLQS